MLAAYNGRAFQQRPGSRASLFAELDRPALRPLPTERYEFAEWHRMRAHVDYHVSFEQHAYSVPHQLHDQELDVRVTASTVEVFHHNRRVASHARSHARGAFTTVAQHMPEAHRAVAEWTPERLATWAAKTGPATAQLIAAILAGRPHPQQGYRACLGVLRLGKSCGEARLELACARALALGAHSYKSVAAILKRHLEDQPLTAPAQTPAIEHDNIRGDQYYAGGNDQRDGEDRAGDEQETPAC